MTDNDKTYRPEDDEDALEFIHRVITEQPDREPLRIVETLVEIAVDELEGRPYDIEAAVSDKRMTVTLHHGGKPINDRVVWRMGDHTDRVDYAPDGEGTWELIIHRNIPPLFVTRR